MTKSNLYSILCTTVRFGAIYLFVDAIVQAVVMVGGEQSKFDFAVWAYALGGPILQGLFALPLWMFPGVLARIAANKRSLEYFESDVSPEVLQYLAFSILGVWFAITGVTQLAYTLHRWIFLAVYIDHHLPDPRSDPKVLGNLLSEITKIFLGIWLTAGSRGLVGMLRRFREAGIVTPLATADEKS